MKHIITYYLRCNRRCQANKDGFWGVETRRRCTSTRQGSHVANSRPHAFQHAKKEIQGIQYFHYVCVPDINRTRWTINSRAGELSRLIETNHLQCRSAALLRYVALLYYMCPRRIFNRAKVAVFSSVCWWTSYKRLRLARWRHRTLWRCHLIL